MLEGLLEKHFGYTSFRNGQKEIIEDVLKGNDVLAVLPTGTGKSICYLLPGYILKGAIMIVSPLLSLMEDQVSQIKAAGEKRVVALNSFLRLNDKRKILNSLHQFRFIFVSPEILQSKEIQSALKKIELSLLVVDEAHCISQWGHDFRIDYLKLGEFRSTVGSLACLALTATATSDVQEDIINQLSMNDVKKHIYSIDRKNIALKVVKVDCMDEKLSLLIETIKKYKNPGIIYCGTRLWTERIKQLLLEKEVKGVAHYHGGLENHERILIQEQFLNGDIQIICATSAFGMGINKPDIRFVIHLQAPSSMEAYLQEIGRAGRDGRPSIAILLYSNEDENLIHLFRKLELPDESEMANLFCFLKNNIVTRDQLEEFIFNNFENPETKARFLQFHLERFGFFDSNEKNLDLCNIQKTLSDIISERMNKKMQKWQMMYQWIQLENCRRMGLLNAFEEELTAPIDSCCDRCNIDESNLIKNPLEKEKKWVYKGWKEEIEAIFSK